MKAAFWFNIGTAEAWMMVAWIRPGWQPFAWGALSLLLAALILWAEQRAAIREG